VNTDQKTKLPKCPYCDFKSLDKEEQKRHLIKEHHGKMVEIAGRYNQSIEWAVGGCAFLFQ